MRIFSTELEWLKKLGQFHIIQHQGINRTQLILLLPLLHSIERLSTKNNAFMRLYLG